MGVYIGTGALAGLFLGTQRVKEVYLGEDLIFRQAADDVLFDNGWIGGISWAGNLLPRPQYTSVGTYSFAYVEDGGYMRLTINSESGYSNVNHNCHVCTAQPITVPAGATKLCVWVKAQSIAAPQIYMSFGLLTAGCVNSMDATNGGQLSAITAPDSVLTKYELALDSGIAGGQYYAIINARRTAQAASSRSLDIYKVSFE